MRVRALQDCFINSCLRKAGQEFDVADDRPINPRVLVAVEDEAPVEKPVAKVAKKAAKKAKKAPEPTEES